MLDNPKSAIELYDELVAYRDALMLKKAEMVKAVIPHEVQEDLDAIEAEIGPKLEAAEKRIADAKALAEDECKKAAQTLRSDNFMVVYSKPGYSVKADDVLLIAHRFEKTHPEVAAELRSIVSLTKAKASVRVKS